MVPGILFAVSLLASGPDVFDVPVGSPFAIREVGAESGSPSHFDGELTLEADYAFEWRVRDGAPETLELRLFPQAEDLNLFPRAKDSPLSELTVLNPEEVATLVLPQEKAQDLLSARVLEISGIARFNLGELQTAVDCDRRRYIAIVLDVTATKLATAKNAIPPRVGC